MTLSKLQKLRLAYTPPLPELLQNPLEVQFSSQAQTLPSQLGHLFPKTADLPSLELKKQKATPVKAPLRVGVLFSGGQAAGGHNVIIGLYDTLLKINGASQLYGFLNGPKGLIENKYRELDAETLSKYRNQGGFDLLGSGRTKIETDEQFEKSLQNVTVLELDGLVIIGGDDSNTSAALLAEYFAKNGCSTTVVGIPKTIDGDLRNRDIEMSFGFDTASKTFAGFVGSVLKDALSAKKYTFFIKLMGRTASHLTLECALQTQPNMAFIGEEIAAKQWSLQQIVQQIAILISERATQGKEYAVILIPEGIVEFIPEIKTLLKELNSLFGKGVKETEIEANLSSAAHETLKGLPEEIRKQLLLDRDPHGNVQVSKIESERLLIALVTLRLQEMGFKGSFSAQPLFCGYEGRSCMPSNFDAQYCSALGATAALLIRQKASGYMACLKNLAQASTAWIPRGIPLASMMVLETRKGQEKPVIAKALVDLEGNAFKTFAEARDSWALDDLYKNPGPIQFFGPPEITESRPLTL